jgi:hypothetical protein
MWDRTSIIGTAQGASSAATSATGHTIRRPVPRRKGAGRACTTEATNGQVWQGSGPERSGLRRGAGTEAATADDSIDYGPGWCEGVIRDRQTAAAVDRIDRHARGAGGRYRGHG